MKELQEILARVKDLKDGESAVLATVVDVQGSSYRLPGARMLIFGEKESIGVVSGGCLEADVVERAKQVLKTGEPQVFTYDTTANEESVFSLNMGCRGVIRIILEKINKQSPLFSALEILFKKRERQFIATLISSDKPALFPIGGRIFYSHVEQFSCENLPPLIENSRELLKDCENFFYQNTRSQTHVYEIAEARVECFFENLNLPPHLLIFGAGADAVPLADFAKSLGWHVSVFDHRAAFASKERFPTADQILVARPENLKLPVDENLAAVVMTHNYEHDKKLLKLLLKSDLKYLGALGPKRRTESILQEIWQQGAEFSDKDWQKLYAPVGLDIGADTPETIALSIIAEIQAVLSNRDAGFLRNRQGSIYNRSTE